MASLSWISSNPDYINQMIRNTQVTLSNNYNDLDNIPIIKITSTTNNPQKVWELKEGLYMINGIVQVDNNTSYEVSNLLISMTARLENGKYILSAFIPYLRGLFEYILKTNSTEYEQHQKIVLMIKNDTLTLDNETIYTPIEDYHPATKKYVDDKANEIVAELDKMGVNKENLESLNKENRIRDIKLQALLSETSDRNITIEENVRYFDMPLSIDKGIVTINEIVGETLVNVCDQEESIAITKSYTVENENHIALQGEYDGKCRPVLHGNTLVNHNADWDDSLQTGIEISASGAENVEVEGLRGQEVSVVVEGNTVLNHALGKTSAVVSAIESENEGNYVDLTVANDMSSVVEIEGRTMVNLCDQKDPIAITKSYTVENSGNHIALQGEYDGSCRPVIQGNTMVNCLRLPKQVSQFSAFKGEIDEEGYLCITANGSYRNFFMNKNNFIVKPSTIYTFVVDIKENTLVFDDNTHFMKFGDTQTEGSLTYWKNTQVIQSQKIGRIFFTLTTRDSFENVVLGDRGFVNNACTEGTLKFKYSIFEGDLTQTPELIPTEYVEGLKSSFEDNVVTQAMVDSGKESAENLGKYKVEYKATGKNKFDINKINWLNTFVSITNNNIVISNTYTNHTYSTLRELGFKANTNYTISRKCDVTREGDETYIVGRISLATTNTVIRVLLEWDKNSQSVIFTEDELDYGLLFYGHPNKVVTFSDVQIEEGTVVTEYEPYKSYTKTFYLNSPLLEGDTIEDINGVATHVKRSGKIVFDGSGDEGWYYSYPGDWWGNTEKTAAFHSYVVPPNSGNNLDMVSTHFFKSHHDHIVTVDYECIARLASIIVIRISKSKLNSLDKQGFEQWLSDNPVTVVYQLASPIYETISEESILCDSYVNGHLDFDTHIPIEKVRFKQWWKYVKYLKPNTTYIIQFESDNVGKSDFAIGGKSKHTAVTKGLNKVNITTGDTILNSDLWTEGIGFNASNIVVTEATDVNFDYFEGLKSSYEYEVTEDGKYKVDVKMTGKNLCDNIFKWGNIDMTTGNITSSSTIVRSANYIPVKPNTDYIISSDTSVTTGSRLTFRFYDADLNYIPAYTGFVTQTTVNGKGYAKATSFNNAKYVKIRVSSAKSLPTDIQLEEGTTATSYEPYTSHTKTFYLNSPLLEGDKIVTKNGKVYHYHKMGMVVLDGSGNWDMSNNLDKTCRFATMLPIDSKGTTTISDYIGAYSVSDNFICDNNTTYDRDEECYQITNITIGGIYIRIFKSKLSSLDVAGFKQWLSENPTTVVYELLNPYYELIDEYNNTILNIPKNVAHLTHTSTVPVNNTVFTNYKDELNVLEANTQYRVMFDCDTANVPFTVTLGGTSQEVTSKKGTHSLLITTPSELVDKNLVIEGIGRCGIDNIRIFKGNVEYDYVKGLWSGYEERKLENLMDKSIFARTGIHTGSIMTINDNYYKLEIGTCNYVINMVFALSKINLIGGNIYTLIMDYKTPNKALQPQIGRYDYINTANTYMKLFTNSTKYCDKFKYNSSNTKCIVVSQVRTDYPYVEVSNILILEGDWTDNPPTYEEVMANEGKYAVKVKLDNPNATIFGKGGRL